MKTIINSILVSLMAFFLPIQGILILVGFAIAMDTIIGLWAAYKMKEKITSKRLGWGVIGKMCAYEFAILLIYGIETLLLADLTAMVLDIHLIITKITALTLISIEAYSIDESWRKFNNGKGIAFYFGRLIKLGKTVQSHIPKRDK